MMSVSAQSLLSGIIAHTSGSVKTFLQSSQGAELFNTFFRDARQKEIEDSGNIDRFYALFVVLDTLLANNIVQNGKQVLLSFLTPAHDGSCDFKSWATFESEYYLYYNLIINERGIPSWRAS